MLQLWRWTPQTRCYLRSPRCLSQMQRRLLLPQTVRTTPAQRNALSSDCLPCSYRPKMGSLPYSHLVMPCRYSIRMLIVVVCCLSRGAADMVAFAIAVLSGCAVRLWLLTKSIILASKLATASRPG